MLSILAAIALLPPPAGFRTELVGPYFVVDAKVNGSPARLIVDTGAGMNVLTPQAAEKLKISGGVPVTARGVGSQGVAARIVTLESFVVESIPNSKPQAVVVPLPPMLEVDGLVGHGFLSQYVASFDYRAQSLSFTRSEDFHPPKGAAILPLRVRGNIPEIQLTVDGVEGWVKIDTGASDSLTLFKTFVDRQKLRERLPNIQAEFGGRGVGGVSESDRARIMGMRLAGFALPETTISLSKQTAGAFAETEAIGNLGAGILRRFQFSLDYRRGLAYFAKGQLFDSAELRDRLGASFEFDDSGHRVVWVRTGSPAFDNGVKVGDKLIAIDGKPVDQERALAVWESFRRPAGTKTLIRIRPPSGPDRYIELTLIDY